LFGTVTPIAVSLQLVTVATAPLNVTVLVPCVAPKVVPATVTGVPTGPEVTERLEIAGVTVNAIPLLVLPLTVTTTLPVVAPVGTVTAIEVVAQLVTVAAVPLKVTVLVPCVVPKVVPLMVTAVPTAPEVLDKLVIAGMTVNCTPLLFTPPTWTTTAPVVALLGTVATTAVLLQLVTVATIL